MSHCATMSEGAPSMVTSMSTSQASTTLANNIFSLSALAALQPNLTAALSMSPAMDFSHGGGVEADAKLIDYRGEKVAGFEIETDTMICLPQAYELFLKTLVGGLHTVYTKLKRLDITPKVCNVEQVRALRSLGAIQPGVNRCKLISCKDFDALYEDCTSTNRPGRPPKRSPISSISSAMDSSPNWSHIFKRPKFDSNGGEQLPNNVLMRAMSSDVPPTTNHQNQPPPLMNPFSAQLMMQHMMSQGLMQNGLKFSTCGSDQGDSNNMGNGQGSSKDPNNEDCGQDEDDDRKSQYSADNMGNTKLCIQQTDDSGPLNLSKVDPTLKQREDGDDNEDNCSSSDEAVNEEDMNDMNDSDCVSTTDDNSAEGGNQSNQDATGDHDPLQQFLANWQNGGSSMLNKNAGYSSVQGLLLNVLGLIEVAAATARAYEQQHNNEKTEMANLLLRERNEKGQLENRLTLERRMRKIYHKRWRQAKRARDSLQSQISQMLAGQDSTTSKTTNDETNDDGSPDDTRMNDGCSPSDQDQQQQHSEQC